MAQAPTSYSKIPIPVIGTGFSPNQVLGGILLLLVAMERGRGGVSDQTFNARSAFDGAISSPMGQP
jgi:hydrogenase maturation factor